MCCLLNHIKQKNIYPLIYILLIFAASILVRLYYIDKKVGFHEDEILSISISNCNANLLAKPSYKEDRVYSGKEFKKSIYKYKSSLKEALRDVKKLYINTDDKPHTNLYYTILRLWFIGFASTDTKQIIHRGCLLNVFIFMFSCLFLYKLLKELFDSELTISFSMILAFINIGSISNSLLMRPYQLQEMFFIVFSYIFIRCYKAIERNESLTAYDTELIVATGLFLLSGYFSTIYVFGLYGILLLFAYKKHHSSNIKIIILSLFGAVAVCRLLYCEFFSGFVSYRAQEIACKFTYKVMFENLYESAYIFLYSITKRVIYGPLMLLISCLIFFSSKIMMEKRVNKSIIILSIGATIWTGIIALLAPFKVMRYMMPAFPIMLLMIPLYADHMKKHAKQIFILVVSAGYILSPFIARKEIDHLFECDAEYVKIISKYDNVLFCMDKQCPFWIYASIAHLFTDDKNFEFALSKASINKKLKSPIEVFLLCPTYLHDEIVAIVSRNYKIKDVMRVGSFFYGYKTLRYEK